MDRLSRIIGFAFLLTVAANAAPIFANQVRSTSEHDVAVLEKRVLACDPPAVRKAFALRSRADGAAREYADTVLGSTIKPCPRVFLAELQRSGDFVRLDSLLGNLGPAYVDRLKAQARELGAREASLRKVRDLNLREIRNRCLDELRSMAKGRSLSNNALERTVGHGGPRLAAASALWPAAQLGR
jgi:hypothetical protein